MRGFGWADLLSCLPVPQLKLLRLFRLYGVGRRLRAAGGTLTWAGLRREQASSALLSLLLMGVLVLEFGSLLVLHFEQRAPGASIVTGSDALWYTLVPDRTRRLQQLLAQSQAMVTGLQALLREASDDTGRGSE